MPSPGKGEVLVHSVLSSISYGSEKLVYKGELNENIVLDTNIDPLNHKLDYPVKYGYSNIGKIVSKGKNVDEDRIGKTVFAFNPHESKFIADVDDLIPVPEKIDHKDFLFLPNVETAINLVLDGAPLIGENVMVIGQGVVGLLTTAVLNEFPIETLITVDPIEYRREVSKDLGADVVLDAGYSDERTGKTLEIPEEGLDLIYEVSGDRSALEKAIEQASYEGRIIVGSWYGDKENEEKQINLGTSFHRNRLDIRSSQVSSIGPEISGRWDKSRRIKQAIRMIKKIEPKKLITHEIPFSEARRAYELLDEKSEECIQVVLEYERS